MTAKPDGGNVVPSPRPAISRITRFSPRTLYRLVRDTLEFGGIANPPGDLRSASRPSGDSRDADIRRFFRDAYRVRFLRELRDTLERRGASACRQAVEQVIEIGSATDPPEVQEARRRAAALRECLARLAGESTDESAVPPPVDLDPTGAEQRSPPSTTGAGWDSVVLPVVIYLPHVRSPYNLGGIIRTAAAFGAAGVVCGPDSPSFDHPRARRAAMGAFDSLPVVQGGWNRVVEVARTWLPHPPEEFPVFAVETGGTPIGAVRIPENSILIFGHEEFGVPREELIRGQTSGGVVTIPHGGTKGSLNVGVSVGIVLAWIDQGLRSIR
ncbi:MAG: TrmH family RNA methyltransferase [Alkalispirochaeta sp.]